MKTLFLFLVMLVPTLVFASAKDAGCSDPIGAQRNNVLSQSGLVSTNATSSPVTITSMASGTSGCKTNGFVREADREAGVYLAQHVDEIKAEIVSGKLQYVLGFEDLVGCKGKTETVLSSMRSNLSPVTSADSTYDKLYGWIQSLRNQCEG